MNAADYLARLQIEKPEPPTLAFLARLQDVHLRTVPFENLSVVTGQEIILEEPWLFDKIIRKGRGGFCYELNGLFSWLLRQLGFRVDRVSARVHNAERGAYGREFDHMALLVHLEQTYLVDVGFGDSFRMPVLFPNGEVADVSGTYRLRQDGTRYILQRREGPRWLPQYQFTKTPRELAEYIPMCHYQQTSPESGFTQRTVCTRATGRGRITLTADTLTITADGQKQKTPVESEADFKRLLREHFGMALDQKPA